MSTAWKMSAERMGTAVELDRQFHMPVRPRFLKELVTVPLPDGLLIEGAGERQVLRGPAATALLPRLLPLLDGTRTLPEVAALLPELRAQSLHDAVALLYTRGVLEDAAAGVALPEDADPNQVAFFRRSVDVTRVHRSGSCAVARLSESHIAAVAFGDQDGSVLRQLTSGLESAGVRRVDALDRDEVPRAGTGLVVALVLGQEPTEALRRLDEACARAGVPWLRAAVYAAGVAELGPYFESGETACYDCFWGTASHPQPGEAQVSPGDARLWAHMLALEAVYVASRIAPLACGMHALRYDLEDWSRSAVGVARRPGCRRCRPLASTPASRPPKRGRPSSRHRVETAVAYEDAVAFPPRHLLDPKAHQFHYRASNLELATEGKRYPSAAKAPLPPQERLALPGVPVSSCLEGPGPRPEPGLDGLHRLAAVLLFTGGFRGAPSREAPNGARRWAPTGGNLGSVELYVAAHHVEGLEPGLYFYEAHEHTLARVRSLASREAALAFIRQACPAAGASSPDAVLVTVGALHRVARKYSAFAYRVVQLDAGVALAQAQAVAHGLGLVAAVVSEWADDVVEEALGLADVAEPVTGLLALRGVSR